jgi:geranylgeranyl diphosphate synthase type II
MDFNTQLKNKIDIINRSLEEYLKPRYPEIVFEAMTYSVMAGGKRLRPVLLLSACEAAGGNTDDALPFACALEMIHTYSLIHDDLPGMDDDDYRRGRLTCHKKYSEGMAILAGDGLLTLAFEIMLNTALEKNDVKYVKAAKIIAEFSGSKGMLVGQVADVCSDGKQIDKETLFYIHENKTAGLIKAALTAGAVIGGADEAVIESLRQAGSAMGLAFQIKDDILDVTSTTEELGKPVGSDEKNQKATYVSMFGLERAKEDYENLSLDAVNSFKNMGEKGKFLAEYAEKLISRTK